MTNMDELTELDPGDPMYFPPVGVLEVQTIIEDPEKDVRRIVFHERADPSHEITFTI